MVMSMNIINFKDNNFTILRDMDENDRIIGYSYYNNIQIIGRNYFYPNVLLYNKKEIINPYDEKIMSLNKDSFYNNNIYNNDVLEITNKIFIDTSVFFLIYNFDNYYHFLYDTLPYLYTYIELKKKDPSLKILVNYPNKDKQTFYRFNTEFLYKLVDKNDIIIHNENNIYKNMIISTSLTHGGLSNNPPRKEIYEIYNILKNNINYDNVDTKYNNLKKIYVSRRTWLNKDNSNIGTDYTLKRNMINESDFVEQITNCGFVEIFTENLNTDEKIYIFLNAEYICGSIGGGMSNLLFSKKQTKTYIIVSPYFLDINYRFKYSLENTNFHYFKDTEIYKKDNHSKYSLYIRVKITNKENNDYDKIGEIVDTMKDKKYVISLSNNDVAGFNNNIKFEQKCFNEDEFEVLDKGLNSPYTFNFSTIIYNLQY